MADDKTEENVKKHIEQIMNEIEMLEKSFRARNLSFSSLSREQVEKKVRRQTSRSPFIYSQGWTSATSPGSSASYQVFISNPDPNGYYPVFASIFFGIANFLEEGDFGSCAARGNFNNDTGWPYMSSPPLGLASGATANHNFIYQTPNAPLTTYIGNCVVWVGQFHDKGEYFDRGLFNVTLL
jgi:hypothetical protein